MPTPNPDKEQIIALVNRLLDRSGLSIKQVLARMQAHGCDISRSTFENRFTSRPDRYLAIPPDWTLALITAFTERLTDRERCTAAEAIELARLAHLPIDRFTALQAHFPPAEFSAAYRRYTPALPPAWEEAPSPPDAPAKQFDVLLTGQAADQAALEAIAAYLTAEAGLSLWPTVGHFSPQASDPLDLDQALAACHTWLLCLGPDGVGPWPTAAMLPAGRLRRAGASLLPVRLPGAPRGKRSRLPALLRQTPWFEFSGDRLAEPDLARLAATIQAAIPQVTPSEAASPDLRCPYRGLRPFEEAQAEFFFGREADTAWLLEALAQSRFLAVIGPSGSGKSSLVRAGLIPALRRGALRLQPDPIETDHYPAGANSQQWLIQLLQPGRRPLESLAVALLESSDSGLNRSLGQIIEELAANEQGLHLLALELLAHRPGKTHLALVVDQFEELFTLGRDEAARQSFIANLLYAASLPGGQTVVILAMRADFYSQAAHHPDLAAFLADHQLLISPLTETELWPAITQPARKVGLDFEPGLAEQLLQDAAAEPGALPLLQYSLLALWERRQGTRLTLAAYQAIGGVRRALARQADDLLAALSPSRQAIVRRVMLRLTRLGEGAADTRRQATFDELIRAPEEAEEVRTVITQLADARLVTTSLNRETGEETVDVAHEALIRGWPTLQNWLAADREALRLHQGLAEAALEWDRHAREEGYLYRGARLAAAEEWAAAHAGELNSLEREFLAAGLAERDRELAARDRRRRWTILGLTVGLLVTLGLALLAFNQWRRVEAEQQMTLSRQLAAQAHDLLDDRLDLALLLGAEAYQTADTLEAESSLLAGITASPALFRFLPGHTGWVWSVAFSPDGQTLASGSADGAVRLWDAATGELLGLPLTGHTDWVRCVAFNPDGHILASGSADGTILLWDVTTGQPLHPPLTGHTQFVTGVTFSPDGQILASAGADGTIILWQVSTGQTIGSPLTGHTGLVLNVTFSPGGQILASSGTDQAIILWNLSPEGETRVQAGQPLAYALTGHQGDVPAIAFSPDGRLLASGSADETIILWDVAAREAIAPPLTGHRGAVAGLAFDPTGQRLVSAGEDQTVRLWDLTNPSTSTKEPPRVLTGHSDRVLAVAFSPDGHTIASGSADGTVALWHPEAEQPPGQTLASSMTNISGLTFNPDETILAADNDADYAITLWNPATGRPRGQPLTGHTGEVRDIAFSPDGQTLASSSKDGAVILWDVAAGRPLGQPWRSPIGPVQQIHFSLDGHSLFTGNRAGALIGWNLSSRQTFSYPLPDPPVQVVRTAFSPKKSMLAQGRVDGSTLLWDATTRQPLKTLQSDHSQPVSALSFSPDGQILAAAMGQAGVIIMWDVTAGQPIRQPLIGHTDWVQGLTFSPDGRLLASGSDDQTIRLWETATHRPLEPSLPGSGRVWRVAFSPDGHTLAAGDSDGRLTLWRIDPAAWQARACRLAGRNLTLAEWEKYIGNQPYRLTCPDWPQPALAAEPLPLISTSTEISSTQPTPAVPPSPISAAIVEEFDSEQGFIQTSQNLVFADGQIRWHFFRNQGKQYVYRSLPAFRGDVRLTVQGQVDSWTSNCQLGAGIGDGFGSGLSISFGYFGDGCDTNDPLVMPGGAKFERSADNCQFKGDWRWIEAGQPYTVALAIQDGAATLSMDGKTTYGSTTYEGVYTTLWVGQSGYGDWPECEGAIESMVIEPLE